jgi:3-phosphoshikimate 1-carboxyvinyltransferase
MTNKNVILIPESGPVDCKIVIPGSKSITNRAILIAALAEGVTYLKSVLHSDDTHFMIKAWRKLGVDIRLKPTNDIEIMGCNGVINPFQEELYIENAGTAARFLTAALTLGVGDYFLTGNTRMQERPISDLIQALNQLGANVVDLNGTKCPPVQISANGLPGGGVEIPGGKSSQYISAIMLTAPYAKQDTIIRIKGNLVSKTYVKMTEQIMSDFGVKVEWKGDKEIKIKSGQHYTAQQYQIEPDASSASYFWGLAAITKGKVEISGFNPQSTQGDVGLIDILEKMGCQVKRSVNSITLTGSNALKGIKVDMNSMSDVAPTLAIIALFAEGKTVIKNVANMRIKECDRITAVCTELKKLGAKVKEFDDGLEITGNHQYHSASINTYDDHRMAMAFSLAGLKIPGINILNPECVSKTFPDYFDLLFSVLKKK